MLKEAVKGRSKLFAGFTLFSLEVFILTLVFALALFVFIVIANMTFNTTKTGFDLKVFHYLSGFVSDVNTTIMLFFSFFGSHTFLIPANLALIAWFLFIRKHRWYSINVPTVALTSLGLMLTLKLLFRRDRPLMPLLKTAAGYSFPSGHALISFTFYGLLIYLVWLNVKDLWLKWILSLTLALLIFIIGLSRIYLRVHYASDVLAGYCVGCMWLLLSLWILNRVEKSTTKKIKMPMQKEPGNSI